MTIVEATREGSREAAGDTLLIDCDVHEELKSYEDLAPYIDPYWQRFVTLKGGWWRGLDTPGIYEMPTEDRARADWVLEDRTRGTDPVAMARHLFDEEGVSHAILCGLFHPSAVMHSYDFMAALAAAYNDWQIEHWLERDSRMFGSVQVVAHMPEVAAREIDRVAEHPSIVQVMLPTVHTREYGDPFYWPIFEAAERNGLVVSLHHGGHTQTVIGHPRSYLEWHMVAAPHANQCQLLSLICNGVFDKFPSLKVVLLETGPGWVPWFVSRLDQQFRELRALAPWVKRMPSEHIRDNVRIATQPATDLTPGQLLNLIQTNELERVFVFATDYPHYDADSGKIVLPNSLPEDIRQRIRFRNVVESFPRLGHLAS